jgi:hypothetical protein
VSFALQKFSELNIKAGSFTSTTKALLKRQEREKKKEAQARVREAEKKLSDTPKQARLRKEYEDAWCNKYNLIPSLLFDACSGVPLLMDVDVVWWSVSWCWRSISNIHRPTIRQFYRSINAPLLRFKALCDRKAALREAMRRFSTTFDATAGVVVAYGNWRMQQHFRTHSPVPASAVRKAVEKMPGVLFVSTVEMYVAPLCGCACCSIESCCRRVASALHSLLCRVDACVRVSGRAQEHHKNMREPVLPRPHGQERVLPAQNRAWRRSQWQAQVLQQPWSPPVHKHRVRASFTHSLTPSLTRFLLRRSRFPFEVSAASVALPFRSCCCSSQQCWRWWWWWLAVRVQLRRYTAVVEGLCGCHEHRSQSPSLPSSRAMASRLLHQLPGIEGAPLLK